MVAVVALHDAADLTGLQGRRRVLKDGDHGAGGVDVSVGVLRPAGVLAVLVRQLAEEGHHIVGGLELGEQVLGGLALFRDLLLAEGRAGGGVLSGQEDVVGVGGVLVVTLLRQVQLTALLERQVRHITDQKGGGLESGEGLLIHSQFLQVLGVGILAAQLLHHGGPVVGNGRLILLREGHAQLRGQVLRHGVKGDGRLRLLLDILAESLVLGERGVPVHRAILDVDQVAAHAIGGEHAELVLEVAAVVGGPVEICLGRDLVAVHGHHRLRGGDAGDVVVNAGGLLLIPTAHAQGQQQRRQQGAHPSFHVFLLFVSGPLSRRRGFAAAPPVGFYQTLSIISRQSLRDNLNFPLRALRPAPDPPPAPGPRPAPAPWAAGAG